MFFIRLTLVVLSLLGLTACLSSGPPVPAAINTAPCKKNGSELVQVKTVTESSGKISIDMIMKLPCSSENIDGGQQLYSMAFYNADKLVVPSDLTNINVTAVNAECDSAAAQEAKAKADTGTYIIDQGSAVSLSIGIKNLNSLQPLYLKYNINNGVGTGTSCALSGSETKPFIIDTNTYSPIYHDGVPVYGNKGEINSLYTSFSRSLVGGWIGFAPMYTYGILLKSDSGGIPGTTVTGGTEFQFDVHLKPGNYYIVFSQVKSPVSGALGDYSLQNPMVFTAQSTFFTQELGFKEYQKDCNKNIQTCGRKYTVH